MYKTSNWNDTQSASQTPLAIWLNGGPGASSIFGNFLENGPLQISQNGTGQNASYTITNNPLGSWADAATMVYVDQPIGTGFSYGVNSAGN